MKNLNLFEDSNNTKQAPLASRMRPLKLDEIVGQQHIIGKDKLLYRAIKADRLGSVSYTHLNYKIYWRLK